MVPDILAFYRPILHHVTLRKCAIAPLLTLLSLALIAPPKLWAQQATFIDISKKLETIRGDEKVPGLIAALVVGERIVAQGVCGERKLDSGIPMQLDDKLHLGSCTKALTASMLATLVAAGKVNWNTRPTEVWRILKTQQHPDFEDVNLEILLAHRSGLAKDVDWWHLTGKKPVTQRARMVIEVLSAPPEHPPGEYVYSNTGYAVAGAMAERLTGKSWEQLMQSHLFRPLCMTSAGFGPPSRNEETDQPWGHVIDEDGVKAVQIDNAPSLGPAGTVHMSIRDWAKFASFHLQAPASSEVLLSPNQIEALQQPFPDSKEPAYGFGWIITRRAWAGGKVLTHTGSNTTWHATIWLCPKKNMALLAVTNTGAPNAHRTCDRAISTLLQVWRSKAWD